MTMKKRFVSKTVGINPSAVSHKKIITAAVLLGIGGFTTSASADLSNGSLGLSIVGNLNPACVISGTYPSCGFGVFDTVDAGSYFNMGGNPAAAVTGIGPLMLSGVAQTHNTSDVSLGNAYVGDSRSLFMEDWDYFSAKGTNGHNGLTVSANDTVVDMGTWFVTWSEVPIIDMGGGAPAVLACTGGIDPNACELGENFTLDYSATVPAGDPSGFGGVAYALHLQGTVVSTNNPPTATTTPFLASGNTGTTFNIDLASNVTDADGTVDNASFQLLYTGVRNPAPTLIDNGSGVISYTDNLGTVTSAGVPDTFTYSVADTLGDRSIDYSVEVTLVQGNIPPVAQSFSVTTDKDVFIVVDVVANTTDDGTVDAATVATSSPVNGTVTNIDAVTGQVTFTPSAGFTGGAGFDYTVDDDMAATSNTATVTITVNDPPVAGNTSVSVDRNSSVVVDVVALASDSDGTLNAASVFASPVTNGGATSVDIGTGKVTYTPEYGNIYTGSDQFTYTIDDNNGATSNNGTVTVTINNALPVANGDSSIVIDTSVNSSVDIDVKANDTDSDGTIDETTVVITTAPANGIALVDAVTGVITYTPDTGYVGPETLQYTIKDNDADASNVATVNIIVSGGNDFCQNAPLTPQSCFLRFDAGNVPTNYTPVLGDGSYFSMEVQPGAPTYTELVPLNGLQINVSQLATTSGSISPNIDQPWLFMGGLGVHQSISEITVISDDAAGNVTIDFSGWNVSWNGIAEIDMGSGLDNGVASMTCYSDDVVTQTQGDCSAGDAFILDYHATVPKGDASGFGGVKYALHLEGVIAETGVVYSPAVPPNTTDIEAIDGTGASIAIQPGSVATAVNNVTGTGLLPADIGVKDPLMNPVDGQQCLGGCIDVVVTGFTGDYVDIIYHLGSPLTEGTIYRKLIDGIWRTFNTSGGDQLGTNADVAGSCTNDEFSPGMTAGDQCLFLRIYDGGPNDADGVKNGTILDPSGVLVAGSPNTPPGSTNGCSISNAKVGITERADWLVVVGFITWFGLMAYRRKKTMS